MDKKYLASLMCVSLLMLSASAHAQRPAAAMEDTAPAAADESMTQGGMNDAGAAADDPMRPAAEAEMTPEKPTVTRETRRSGDVLNMSTEAVAEPVRQLDFPRRGMSQDKVQNELGRPLEIVPAVGEPPISRWVYDDRVVYFEFASVIHVVAR